MNRRSPNNDMHRSRRRAILMLRPLPCGGPVMSSVRRPNWELVVMFETQISSDHRHRNIFIGIVFLVCFCLAASMVLLWSYIFSDSSDDRFVPITFNSTQWKEAATDNSKYGLRVRMIDDLLGAYKLEGKSRAEIIDLLGEPEDNRGLKEWDMVYCLGPERSWISMDAEWLVLRLNERQEVIECRVITT